MKKTLLIIGAVALLLVAWISSSYNQLVDVDEQANQAYSDVETTLQRRFDLIDNLVATVKGAADFEKGTFTEVTEARSAWAKAQTPGEKFEASNQMDSALSRLLVTVENYPDLKATQNFKDLQVQLEGTENRIAVARKNYNAVATTANKAFRSFPKNFLAMIFGFERHELFEASEGAETAPEVDFS